MAHLMRRSSFYMAPEVLKHHIDKVRFNMNDMWNWFNGKVNSREKLNVTNLTLKILNYLILIVLMVKVILSTMELKNIMLSIQNDNMNLKRVYIGEILTSVLLTGIEC